MAHHRPTRCTWPTVLLFYLLCLYCGPVVAKLVNISVDDGSDDIFYSPPEAWAQRGGRQGCDRWCMAKGLNTSEVFRQTWHEGIAAPRIITGDTKLSFSFLGVGVSVHGIVAASPGTLLGRSDMAFFIDGQQVYIFSQDNSNVQDVELGYQYNYTLFHRESLSLTNKNHSLGIQIRHDQTSSSVILLDYITYSRLEDDDDDNDDETAAEPPPSPTQTASENPSFTFTPVTTADAATAGSSSQTPKIVGGVIGGIVILLLIAGGFFIYRRKKQKEALLPTIFPPLPKPHRQSQSQSLFQLQTQSTDEGSTDGRHQTYTFNPSLLVRAREIVKHASSSSMRNGKRRPAPLEEELIPQGYDRSSRIPNSAMYSANDQLLSIQSWRAQTIRETQFSIPPSDMSEELSSYYETGTHRLSAELPSIPMPAPPRPARRWAVMNK